MPRRQKKFRVDAPVTDDEFENMLRWLLDGYTFAHEGRTATELRYRSNPGIRAHIVMVARASPESPFRLPIRGVLAGSGIGRDVASPAPHRFRLDSPGPHNRAWRRRRARAFGEPKRLRGGTLAQLRAERYANDKYNSRFHVWPPSARMAARNRYWKFWRRYTCDRFTKFGAWGPK